MQKSKTKKSTSEKILKLADSLKNGKSAEEIKTELKDRFGYNIDLAEIRVNLLYLLRREKIKRKKEKDVYKYYV